jgi:hypothetical protein
LIPGKTTREEAVQVLQELLNRGQVDQVPDFRDPAVIVVLRTRSMGFLLFDGDVLVEIDGHVEFDYTVDDLLTAFGPPGGIYPYPMSIGSGNCQACPESNPGAELSYYHLQAFLVYPEQGFTFVVHVPSDLRGCICPGMRVDRFCYYAPQSMEDKLSSNLRDQCTGYLEGISPADFVRWHGFGGGY